ncbi:ABC transporter [Flavipsychrobacter stenotrophus]|uniref:ABC transporter n=2 Tax=Flavipsychrobacter stenotrophus TaxID=2077091 RepID=A0A2S7SXH6_9BACT|nr:ABC transporter [Flavipsychrobacter stenotrophus]
MLCIVKPSKFVGHMQLSLHQLVPLPLREKIAGRSSGIWEGDLVLNEKDHVFIKAPSGTGKTTLIHMLYGMRDDYEGTVKWDNLEMKRGSAAEISQLRTKDVSVIFQDMRLFPELTAWENLDIKRRLTNTITAQQVTNWMDELGVADKRLSLARKLSYGEQQRVAIIRALLQPFKWLLMDEPFSHLDHVNIAKATKLISEVVKQNNAGMILADLDDNNFFPYTQTIVL